MNFKFLKNLSNEEAGEFFKQLAQKLGESFDDGNLQRLHQFIVEWQSRGYAAPGSFAYADAPFTPLSKPIAQSRLMLLTSSGHFVEGHDPEPFGIKDMSQQQAEQMIDDFLKAEPTLTTIPINTPINQLRVRHGGYDIHGAQTDPNVALPLERLRELQHEGVIGTLVEDAFSFVGATAQTRLLKHSGPEWVKLFKQKQVDAALLVPV
ncbi:MAG: glycine/betaine/sarcosine/D-proline family reductase selenoprotein B [Anaerolineales bacterium]|nr:glycine/betaine/sarcosine/D-proline family reductase selenoprotein B [Anaerolineales bacterium]